MRACDHQVIQPGFILRVEKNRDRPGAEGHRDVSRRTNGAGVPADDLRRLTRRDPARKRARRMPRRARLSWRQLPWGRPRAERSPRCAGNRSPGGPPRVNSPALTHTPAKDARIRRLGAGDYSIGPRGNPPIRQKKSAMNPPRGATLSVASHADGVNETAPVSRPGMRCRFPPAPATGATAPNAPHIADASARSGCTRSSRRSRQPSTSAHRDSAGSRSRAATSRRYRWRGKPCLPPGCGTPRSRKRTTTDAEFRCR